MHQTCIDHIVVTASSLDEGEAFVVASLGVAPQAGGEHERMGTHNRLLRLGDSLYLEVIAPNPAAAKPQRPRWFDLDSERAVAQPRLATWVVRTDRIEEALGALTEPVGRIEPMSRGALRWLISIPEDGRLRLAGAAPALIQWQVPVHPAAGLRETGCSLAALELHHPEPQRVAAFLESLHLADDVPVSVHATSGDPFLVARIRTPNGLRTLGAPKPIIRADTP